MEEPLGLVGPAARSENEDGTLFRQGTPGSNECDKCPRFWDMPSESLQQFC